jgi:hypothetical protein
MQGRVFETTEGHLQGGHLYLEIEGKLCDGQTSNHNTRPKP